MRVPRSEVAEVLAKKTLSPTLKPKSFSRSVAAYLLDSGRTSELESLLRDIVELRAKHGVVEVEAISAHPLTLAVRRDIDKQVKAQYPKAKKVLITEQRDPRVVGGVKLQLPTKQLDLTVLSQLNRFKQLTARGE